MIDHLDAQQLFLKAEMQTIMDRLADAQERILYLASPVQEISRLHKNASGRYETEQGNYFCSGSQPAGSVQFLLLWKNGWQGS